MSMYVFAGLRNKAMGRTLPEHFYHNCTSTEIPSSQFLGARTLIVVIMFRVLLAVPQRSVIPL